MKRMSWLAALVVLLAVPAFAHTDDYFDNKTAPHGGQQRMSGPYHIELVTGPGEITVYLANHADGAMPTAGGEGKAVVKSKEGVTTIQLTPAGENMLKGKGEFTLDPESTVMVFVKMPEQEAWAAKFTPLKPKSSAAVHDHKGDHGADGDQEHEHEGEHEQGEHEHHHD